MSFADTGDWGTQFGMLIAYLQWQYTDILTNVPDISDLKKIYQVSNTHQFIYTSPDGNRKLLALVDKHENKLYIIEGDYLTFYLLVY